MCSFFFKLFKNKNMVAMVETATTELVGVVVVVVAMVETALVVFVAAVVATVVT